MTRTLRGPRPLLAPTVNRPRRGKARHVGRDGRANDLSGHGYRSRRAGQDGPLLLGVGDPPCRSLADSLVVMLGVVLLEADRFGCERPHGETLEVISRVASRDPRRQRGEILRALLRGPVDRADVLALICALGWPGLPMLVAGLDALAGAALDEVTAARRALLVAELSGAPPEGSRRVLLRELADLEVTP